MTQQDTFYRAFGEFLNVLKKDPSAVKMIDAVVKAKGGEQVTVSHNVCHVEEDWLRAIERGLVFIGKAIEEDRQFIRSDGEVQPIEKVKRISKESVQHLSRHSDMITRKQQEEIVPDKLYTVERDSDYAVYENKFLYLLLCKIRDFVGIRYGAIADAYKEYKGKFEVSKKVTTATRRLNYTITLTDEQDDIVSAPADSECAVALDRIDKIVQSVSFFLRTPLMQEVSRSDKIRTKITKTNVLMMNKNFHEALLLYEFLLGYESDGYSIENVVKKLDPVPEDASRDFAVPAILTGFLVYEHGLGLEEYLKGEFEKEEARLEEERQLALKRRIADLKKRVEATGKGMEEYMLSLEERNAELEKYVKLLDEAKAEIEELKRSIEDLKAEITVLGQEIEKLNAEKEELIEKMRLAEEEHQRKIAEMQREHAEEIEKLNAEHAEEIENIKRKAEEDYAALKKQKDEEIAELKARQAEELNALKEAQRQKIEDMRSERQSELARMREDYEKKLAEGSDKLKNSLNDAQRVKDELVEVEHELKETALEKDLIGARLIATRREYGLPGEGDDFTSEEGFNALEHEFEVLGRMVRDEWSDVKKMLRREFYSGIRTAMRTKKPKKTKEYSDLSARVKSRGKAANTPDDAPAGNAENKGNSENTENTENKENKEPPAGNPDGKPTDRPES